VAHSQRSRPIALGVYRAENQTFVLGEDERRLTISQVRFGSTLRLPLAGDFDGDGFDTLGLSEPTTGRAWLFSDNSAMSQVTERVGPAGARPVVGDWDGDGRDSLGWFLPATGVFELGEAGTLTFGVPGGWPVAGDWDGDGRDGLGVWSPETGVLELRESPSADSSSRRLSFPNLIQGLSLPVAADLTGSGKQEPLVFASSTSTFWGHDGQRPVAVKRVGLKDWLVPVAGRFAPVTPSPGGYGWPTGTPASQGIDGGTLERVVLATSQLENVRSLLVVRRGVLVREQLFDGVEDRPENVQSVSKSVTSALVGIALQEGLLDLDRPVISYLPEAFPADGDARRQRLAVKHLVTMTSGLEMDDDEKWVRANQAPDVVKAVLAAPMVAEPGTTFRYATGVTHVLGAVLERVTGKPLDVYAREKLFRPIGVDLPGWATDRNGVVQGGSSLVARPRDLARFGELYLRRGRLDGKQVVPEAWVAASTTQQAPGSGTLTYGASWWLTRVDGLEVFEARGHGGQLIAVVPALELVVVFTSKPNVSSEVSNLVLGALDELVVAVVRASQ
jgi:CubicO group peptidase (beta-lactamase class C family)